MLDYTQISGVHTENKYLRQRYDTGVVNRPAGYQLGTSLNADSDMETTYAYVANDGRLSQVTTESFETHVDTFTYSYGSAGQYGPTLLSGPQIYSAKSYLSGAPYFDIIDNKTSSGGSTVAKADYRYDTLGRRDRKDFSGNAYGSATYDTYSYNVNFEVTQGKRFTSGGAAVSGKEYNFTYDDIGNRLTSRDKYTTSTYDTTYTPNARNQYTGITGYHAASPVTYDTDGNLSALGTKTFLYNGENQLIEVKVGGSSVASFKYDYLGRRVEKSTPSKTETYAYDGWNLIALYDTGTGDKRPLITYSWGLDLNDTMQGAGGVGGLLMSCERDGTAWTYFEDGHGNVTQVVSQSSGSVNAHMEYDPYGNLATTAPAWDRRNAFRFSSKFYDDETGLYYYGYRYYDPVTGRWGSRDPIGEQGGLNLYGHTRNNSIDRVDATGLCEAAIRTGEYQFGNQWTYERAELIQAGTVPRPGGSSIVLDGGPNVRLWYRLELTMECCCIYPEAQNGEKWISTAMIERSEEVIMNSLPPALHISVAPTSGIGALLRELGKSFGKGLKDVKKEARGKELDELIDAARPATDDFIDQRGELVGVHERHYKWVRQPCRDKG